MPITLRDVRPGDLTAVLELNQRALPAVSSEKPEWVQRYAREARYFRVAVYDGAIVGFVVGMTPDTEYDSENFRWFGERYDSFAYLDRIVVTEEKRGQGIGRLFYEDFARFARDVGAEIIALEVNTRPRNEPSLRFHERLGFEAVGTQDTEGGKKTVQLMTKRVAASDSALG